MTIDLSHSLSWINALSTAGDGLSMLADLQGNILKGHGRHHTSNIFVAFEATQRDAAREFVAKLGSEVTRAVDQLVDAQLFKAAQKASEEVADTAGREGKPFIAAFLTAAGYQALGADASMPTNAAFTAGMHRRDLADPPSAEWELTGELHGLILLAANSTHNRDRLESEFRQRIDATEGAVRIVAIEQGNALLNDDNIGIEHFGYVDGRSQPLALVEDLQREDEIGGRDKWDPEIPLSQLLVKCPGGSHANSFGSYFVFRKLEQNVRGFKRREIDLAEQMPTGENERAGASVVGRFERGNPVVASKVELKPEFDSGKEVSNNFNFEGDPNGLKCPFASHIRKTNPRTDTDDSKTHLMARRGIPYGVRTDSLDDPSLDSKPTGGVGLLFMAYQSSLEDQFEFTQRAWVNNPDFRNPETGIDPVIGQGEGARQQRYPKIYGVSLTDPFDFSGFVSMKGGQYFFAPSISCLRGLDG